MALTAQQRAALGTWTSANLQKFWAEARKKNPSLPATPPGGFTPNIGGFTPFKAPDSPPPGTYDPALDSQLAAGGRGFHDLESDTETANTRAGEDFTTQTGNLQTQIQNALTDAASNRSRAHADYETAIGDLNTSYDRLGNRQAQQQQQATMDGGFSGAVHQALVKREANLAHDRAPLDTNEQRAAADYTTLVGDGTITGTGRLQQGYTQDVGALSTNLTRGTDDRKTGLERGTRELANLGTDVAAQRFYQASQVGYAPPSRPKGEHVDKATGQSYRLIRLPNGKLRKLLSSGRVVAR